MTTMFNGKVSDLRWNEDKSNVYKEHSFNILSFSKKMRIDTIIVKMNHRIRGKSLKFKTFWTYVGKIQQLNRLLPRFALSKM